MGQNIRISWTEREKLRHIIRTLEDEGQYPWKITTIRLLQNCLRDVTQVEVEVDQWPNVSTVLSRLIVPGVKFHPVYVYCTNSEILKEMLKQSNLVDWSKRFTVCALPMKLLEVIQEVATLRNGRFEMEMGKPYNMTLGDKDDPLPDKQTLISSLPAGWTIGNLRPEHAPLVTKCWSFGDTSREAQIRLGIERLPNICIYNDKGEPVSWNNTHMNGSGAIGHTLDKYRRMGLYKINMALFARQRIQCNMPMHGFVLEGNTGAEKASFSTTQGPWAEKVVFAIYHPAESKL